MAAFDEMVDGHGGVRRHWRAMLGTIAYLDTAALANRAVRLARFAAEEGMAAACEGRPGWICDPLPLPLAADEFAVLAAGLAQRARLLEALLVDLHGPQQVLAAGVLPSALVFANPGFERACCGLPGPFLQTYAADLVRGPDGHWRVLADRLAGALGIGFVPEVRRALAHVQPELYDATRVRPIRPFFEAWQEALIGPAPGLAPGFAAVLSPGADDAGWRGNLALARALGCAVVEPADLTVRGGAIVLKVLGAARRVDVLLRRVPTRGIDPLEMTCGDPVGASVPGLLDAVRGGAVRVLNGLGTELAQAPALAAFLPALCRNLLGEPLQLATVPTLWLADAAARATVRQNLGRWAIRPAMDDSGSLTSLQNLLPERRAVLDLAISERPWEWVASTPVEPSSAPSAGEGGREARPVVLRLFLVCEGVNWRAVPGGLARVLAVGEQPGGRWPAEVVVKDVVVLHEEEGSAPAPVPQRLQPRVRRAGGELPARVAGRFYALGQHLERLDCRARLGLAALARTAGAATSPRDRAESALLARCLGEFGMPVTETPALALRSALLPGGAMTVGIDAAARLIEGLRDQLTGRIDRTLREALRALRADAAGSVGEDAIARALATALRLSLIASGIASDAMARDGGARFLDLGRQIERAQAGACALALILDQPAAWMEGALGLALDLADGIVIYRARYSPAVQAEAALDVLVADSANPRSLVHQLARASALLSAVEGGTELAAQAEALRARADRVVALMRDAADLAEAVGRVVPALRAVEAETRALCERVQAILFPPAPPPTVTRLDAA